MAANFDPKVLLDVAKKAASFFVDMIAFAVRIRMTKVIGGIGKDDKGGKLRRKLDEAKLKLAGSKTKLVEDSLEKRQRNVVPQVQFSGLQLTLSVEYEYDPAIVVFMFFFAGYYLCSKYLAQS